MRDRALQVATLMTAGLVAWSISTAKAADRSVWNPDGGDGTCVNPVLFADYSDPDVVRVGGDFYLVASSFSSVPGLPILHSTDLVNWTIVGHAVPRLGVGERVGLVVMGRDTASVAIRRNPHGLVFVASTGTNVDADGADLETPDARLLKNVLPTNLVNLRVTFEKGGRVRFDADADAVKFVDPGPGFVARPGVWVGARIGLFASAQDSPGASVTTRGYADVDWFRVEHFEKERIQ